MPRAQALPELFPSCNEVLRRQANVLADLAQKEGRDITAGMNRNRGHAPVRVAKLAMGSTLPHLDKAQAFEDADDLSRLEDREAGHVTRRGWCACR